MPVLLFSHSVWFQVAKSPIKMEKSAAQVPHLFCGCLAEAGIWMVLSVVGLLCLRRVTFCCAPHKAGSPPWTCLLSLGYVIAKILRFWCLCPGHRGVRKGRILTEVAGCKITAEEFQLLRAERGRTLYSCVLHCCFISFVWLQETLFSLILEFA